MFQNNTSPGFLSRRYQNPASGLSGNVFTNTRNLSLALTVQLPSGKLRDLRRKVFDFKMLNGPDPALPYLGAAFDGSPLAGGSSAVTWLTSAAQVPRGASGTGHTSMTNPATGEGAGETTIWSIDCSESVSANYVNPGGKSIEVGFVSFKRGNGDDGSQALALTGGVDAVKAQYGTNVAQVSFEYLPMCGATGGATGDGTEDGKRLSKLRLATNDS